VGVLKFRIIVITGTPGVGKTTIAKALAKRLNALYVSVGELVKDENLIVGVDEDRNTLIADLKRLTRRINTIILQASQDVIVEGHYASDVLQKNLVSFAFVLRKNPEDLKMILEKKGFEEKKILENIASELLDVCLINTINNYGEDIVNEIDVSQQSVEEVINEIIFILEGQQKRNVGNVNWIEKLEKYGKLRHYLHQIEK
jgi:adenylate kinase